MTYPTILSLPDGSDLILEQTSTTTEIRVSLPRAMPVALPRRISGEERQPANNNSGEAASHATTA